jgi:hypothetical protein
MRDDTGILTMSSGRGVIAVVDDDLLMVKALERLLRASGFDVATFETRHPRATPRRAADRLLAPLPVRPAGRTQR